MENGQVIIHNIPPVWDSNSRLMILGSFPSEASRKSGFFYGHKRNRFWKVVAEITNCPVPESVGEKTSLLHNNHIALWDVVSSCDIDGSSDISIRNVIPNDIGEIIASSHIERIYANGTAAAVLYRKLIFPNTGIECRQLPSTSPANASWTCERLCEAWREIIF